MLSVVACVVCSECVLFCNVCADVLHVLCVYVVSCGVCCVCGGSVCVVFCYVCCAMYCVLCCVKGFLCVVSGVCVPWTVLCVLFVFVLCIVTVV